MLNRNRSIIYANPIVLTTPSPFRSFSTGTLQATLQTELKLKASGLLLHLEASENRRFQKGDVVAQLDPSSLAYGYSACPPTHCGAGSKRTTLSFHRGFSHHKSKNWYSKDYGIQAKIGRKPLKVWSK